MLSALWELIGGGWREVRAFQGHSYQVHRSGKRRVVPIEAYQNRGMPDEGWVGSGEGSDAKIAEKYRDYTLRNVNKPNARLDHPRFRKPGAMTSVT